MTIKAIIQDLMANPNSHLLYQWKDCILYKKKRGGIIVGNNPGLLNDLIFIYHNSLIGGHSSSIVNAKKVGDFLENVLLAKEIRHHHLDCYNLFLFHSPHLLTSAWILLKSYLGLREKK